MPASSVNTTLQYLRPGLRGKRPRVKAISICSSNS